MTRVCRAAPASGWGENIGTPATVTAAHRRWWRARFSEAELVELATAIWPDVARRG